MKSQMITFQKQNTIQSKISKISMSLRSMQEEFGAYLGKLKNYGEINNLIHKIDTKLCKEKSQILVNSLVVNMERLLQYLQCIVTQINKELVSIKNQIVDQSQSSVQLLEIPVHLYSQPKFMQQKQQNFMKYFEQLIQTKTISQIVPLNLLHKFINKLQTEQYLNKLKFMKDEQNDKNIYEIPLQMEIVEYNNESPQSEGIFYQFPSAASSNQIYYSISKPVKYLDFITKVYNQSYIPEQIVQLEVDLQNNQYSIFGKKFSTCQKFKYDKYQDQLEIQVQIQENDSSCDEEYTTQMNFTKYRKQQIQSNLVINQRKSFQITQPLYAIKIGGLRVSPSPIGSQYNTPRSSNFQSQSQDEAFNMREKYSSCFGQQNVISQQKLLQKFGNISDINEKALPSLYYEAIQHKTELQQMIEKLNSKIATLEKQIQEGSQKSSLAYKKYEQQKYQKIEIIKKIAQQIDKYEQKLEQMALSYQEKAQENRRLIQKLFEKQEIIEKLQVITKMKQQEKCTLQEKFLLVQNQFKNKVISLEKQIIQKNKNYQILRIEILEIQQFFKNQSKHLQHQNQQLKNQNDILVLDQTQKIDQIQALRLQLRQAVQKITQIQEIGLLNSKNMRKSKNSTNQSKKVNKNKLQQQNLRLHKQLVDRLQDLQDAKLIITEQQQIIHNLKSETMLSQNMRLDSGIQQQNQYLRKQLIRVEQLLQQKQIIIQFLSEKLQENNKNHEASLSQQCDYKQQILYQQYKEDSNLTWITEEITEQIQYTQKLEKLILKYEAIIFNNMEAIKQLHGELSTFVSEGIQKQSLNQQLLKQNQLLKNQIDEIQYEKSQIMKEKMRLKTHILQNSIMQNQQLVNACSIEAIYKQSTSFQHKISIDQHKLIKNKQIQFTDSLKYERTDDQSIDTAWKKSHNFVPVRNRHKKNQTFYKKVNY